MSAVSKDNCIRFFVVECDANVHVGAGLENVRVPLHLPYPQGWMPRVVQQRSQGFSYCLLRFRIQRGQTLTKTGGRFKDPHALVVVQMQPI